MKAPVYSRYIKLPDLLNHTVILISAMVIVSGVAVLHAAPGKFLAEWLGGKNAGFDLFELGYILF